MFRGFAVKPQVDRWRGQEQFHFMRIKINKPGPGVLRDCEWQKRDRDND